MISFRTPLLDRAIEIIEKSFKDKVDLGGEPYVNHLKRTRQNVVELFDADEELQCIALLHDLFEDCPEEWNAEKLSEEFPERVVSGVVSLTKKEGQDYNDYILGILRNADPTKVKIGDVKDNMDVSRLKYFGKKEVSRLEKYHRIYLILNDTVKLF